MTDPLLERDPALTDEATCERFIERAFSGDRRRYETFVETLRAAIPPNVSVIVRGSSITGERHGNHAPFDADGPGTSDIDLTLVGGDMIKLYDEYHIPGVHSVPMGEDHPDAAPSLRPLRERLCEIAGRPVNVQATTDLVQYVRDVTMGQPYLVLLTRRDEGNESGDPHDAAPPIDPMPDPNRIPMLGPP
jgi:hypothetical protein